MQCNTQTQETPQPRGNRLQQKNLSTRLIRVQCARALSEDLQKYDMTFWPLQTLGDMPSSTQLAYLTPAPETEQAWLRPRAIHLHHDNGRRQ